jgi:hypothetical protein
MMPPDHDEAPERGLAAARTVTARVVVALEARGGVRHGDEIRFRCAVHEDTVPSAEFNIAKEVWKCFSCGAKGGVHALARHLGLESSGSDSVVVPIMGGSNPAARRAKRGGAAVSPPRDLQSCNPPRGLTLAGYAAAKQLPETFLKSIGLSDISVSRTPAVKLPYRDETGQEVAARFRFRMEKTSEDDRFTWRKGSKAMPYGLERLARANTAGMIVLVEGESDCHTLWHHDVPALGIPGASNWKEAWATCLEAIPLIYLVIEPDVGGATLQAAFAKSVLRDRVQLIDLGDAKDPSGLYLLDPGTFPTRWAAVLPRARPLTDVLADATRTATDAAWTACAALAREPDLLAAFERDLVRLGVVGQSRVAKLVYLAVTSRLFARPISLAVKGPSSAGKSFEVERALEFFPASAFYSLTAMSDRSLAYSEEPLVHRILVLYEAAGMKSDFASYLIRSLLSEGRLRYETVERTPEGLKPRLIEREGPTGLITTTTAVRLHPENETRLLSISVDDTPEQTKRVFQALASSTGGAASTVDFAPWHALQTWLANSPTAVVVPFDVILADMVPAVAVRQRRDFGLLLRLIEAHALLHCATRDRDADGRIMATLADYAAIRELVNDLLGEAVRATISATTRETVVAVALLQVEDGVPVTAIARHLKLDHSATYRRIATATDAGYLTNLETRKGRPGRYAVGDPMPDDIALLPAADAIEAIMATETKGGMHDCRTVPGNTPPPSPPSDHHDDEALGERGAICDHCGGMTRRRRADGGTAVCIGCSA